MNPEASRHVVSWSVTIAILSVLPTALSAQVDVLTNRYDGARTGANLNETTLTPANVNVSQFGKLYSYPVDGAVYAQPLYARDVMVGGVARNVLYIVTMNNKVYAFDADSASPTPLWVNNIGNAFPVTDIVATSKNIYGNIGIESTPVIDPLKKRMYLVARTKEGTNYFQRLHALDITTGVECPGSPVVITASVPSLATAPDSTLDSKGNWVLRFDPKMEHQRAALALTSNDVVLIAWAGHEDLPPYHGWIMGYDAATLARVGVFAVTPDVYGGGVWQGGRAPTLDADGNAYFATGNGKFDGTRNYGDSLLRVAGSASGLSLHSHFTPDNEQALDKNDDDLSGSGFTLLAGPNGKRLLLGGGKEGTLYLLDADDLRGKVTGNPQAVQEIPVSGGHVMGGPVLWRSVTGGPLVFNWSEDDVLRGYRQLPDGTLEALTVQGVVRSPGHPGGSLTLSAAGSDLSTGIVWSSMPTYESAKHVRTAGTVRAHRANTLAQIWSSDDNPERDAAGRLMKFVPPLVANGRVYMPNDDNAVSVYGLLPPQFGVGVTPRTRTIAAGASGIFSVTVGAYSGFAGTVTLSAAGGPAGSTVTFTPQTITRAGVATMTVTLAPGTSTAAFGLTVTGTSGTQVHAAQAVVNGPEEIVLYGKNANPVRGNWRLVSDPTAAGGARIEQPDAGVAKIPTPAAAPANYFELTFTAKANTAYRLWMRARAQNNSYNNDSVYAQFSGSVTSTGAAANRIGTTQAVTMVLEDCGGCGVAGWGWQDNGYGTGILGPLMYFTAGSQTIRIQGREDGISIDQIVLSPVLYLTQAPGPPKNDGTILPASRTIVLYTKDATAVQGHWRPVDDPTAANRTRLEQPNAGVPKIPTPVADPANYFELKFTAEANTGYRLWMRGRAQGDSYNNDSVYVQFSGSVTGAGAAIDRIGTTTAETVVIEDCAGCGLAGWGWQDNAYGAGVLGPLMYFTAGQ